MSNLNELAKQFHEKAKAKGFWDEPRETGTLLMLMVSELSEALEADRKNKHAVKLWNFENNIKGLDLTRRYDAAYFAQEFEVAIKDTFEDEIADVFIRLLDFIGQRNIDIEKHIELKMLYNQTRPYKHGKQY